MNLGPHAAFIIVSYAAAVAVVGALIAWMIFDFRAQRRALGDLEAHRRLLLVRLVVLVPLAIFLAIVAVFWSGLFSGRDPSLLPSVLIGHPAPQTPLPPVEGLVRNGQPVPG